MNCETKHLKTWCSIDLDAIAHNYNQIKKNTGSRIISIVKANAYGHGAVPVARRLIKEGCDYFAVSSLEEALELRNAGIKSSILVLGYILPERLCEAVENGISLTCASYEFASLLCSQSLKSEARVHIKLDTGMNRTGFNICHSAGYERLEAALDLLKQNEKINIEGVFSHFAKADDDKEFSEKQFGYFNNAADFIKKCGVAPSMLHICNSCGTYNFPSMHLDAVRVGIHLYGCEGGDDFIPAMDFCTRIVDIHTLCEGDGVSYGQDFIADRKMKIAVIGAGYADGLFRSLSGGKGYVKIRGKSCPIIGRVCMDMTMVDISDIPDASVGDAVTIWGKELSAEEQAKNAGTISYELMCSVSPRVSRVY